MSKHWDTPFGPSEVICKNSLQVPETCKEKAKSFTSLEEAANEFANQDCVTFASRKKGFIAGAEWQKERDIRDMYMSDNRHFQKVYELGKKDMKEQMMKEAVEGTLGYGPHLQRPIIMLEQVPDIWNGSCQSVKIIIVKE